MIFLFYIKVLVLTGLLIFHPLKRHDRFLTESQKVEARDLLVRYMQTFEDFANAGNLNDGASARLEIGEMFQGLEHYHYNDLFEDASPFFKIDIEHYCNLISTYYNYQLQVDFVPIIDVQSQEIDNVLYARFLLQKSLQYKGENKTVESVVMINMDIFPPRINEIGPAEVFDEVENCNELTLAADQYFSQGQVFRAQESYRNSLACRENAYVSQRLSECSQFLERQKSFDQYMSAGDSLLTRKVFALAKQNYEHALELFPKKIEVTDKLNECNRGITNQQQFQYYLSEGDSFFESEYYSRAKAAYTSALSFKPNTSEVLNKVRNCEMKLEELKHRNLLKEAEVLFTAQNFRKAKVLYQELAEQFSGDKSIILKINACETELLFAGTVKKADQLFLSKKYLAAKQSFEVAYNLKPGEPEVSDKIIRCEAGLNYLYYQDQGDIYFFQKKFFARAKSLYERALEYMPGEVYALRQIGACKREIEKLERTPEAINAKLKQAVYAWNDANTKAGGRKANYQSAFLILDKYKDSGLLEGKHYYILGELYRNNFGSIRKLKGITESQAAKRGTLYLYKAVSKKYDLAKTSFCLIKPKMIKTLNLKINCNDR